MKKILDIFFSLVLCVIATVGSTLTFDYNRIISILLFFVMLIISIWGKREDKRVKITSLIFSVLYVLGYVIGYAVYNTGVINTLYRDSLAAITTIISIVGSSYMLYLINYYLFYLIDNYKMKIRESKLLNKSYIFLYVWLIIFLLWIPCFLSYFPGIYSYDITKQVNEVFNLSYSKFHPPIHTGIVAIMFFIANKLNVQMIEVYSIVQMILLSYALTKMLKFLYQKSKSKIFFIGAFIFLVLNPVMPIIALLPAKDIYFTAFLLLLIPELYELIYNKEEIFKSKFSIVKIVFFSLMAMLFRNNASYVFIIFFIVLVILERKDKRMVLISLVPVVLFLLVNNVLYPNIGVRDGNSREKLSLPMMQIAYVVQKNEDDLTKEELDWVEKYLPVERIKNYFNPRFADPIKSKFKTNNYDKNPKDFYKLYIKLGSKYLDDYISAFLNLNIPYWFIEAETIDPYAERGYLETGIYDNHNYFFERRSKLPKLYDFYEKFANYEIEEKHFILDKIYSLNLPIWLLIFMICVAILKRQYKSIMVVLPLVLLWLTYLLGPVSNFRYIIPIYVMYPVIVYFILKRKEDTSR